MDIQPATGPAPLPAYFLSHGGGPWPYMKEELGGTYDRLEASLAAVGREVGRPAAILIVSAHWEEPELTVMTGQEPGMIYDYGGFPEHTYRVRYPAPGSPAVGSRVIELLARAGIEARSDPSRGFDHGVFVPLAVAYPEADVPVVQLSIRAGYDPATHLVAGRALEPLRREGVLILGSGLSYHNLRALGAGGSEPSRAFDAWLTHAVCDRIGDERSRALEGWASAPSARAAHPREDHLVPLFVVAGAAENDVATRVYHEDEAFGAIAVSSYRFGATPVD